MRKLLVSLAVLLILLAVSFTVSAESRVIPHEGNILFPESEEYAVTVNGIKVPVRAEIVDEYPWNVAMFSVEGTYEVKITALNGLSTYKLTPAAYNILPEVEGDTLTFSVDEPKYLLLDMKGATSLLLIVTPPETEIPNANDPNVKYFGPGIHEAGVINLKSNETCYIASGAVVIGRIQGVCAENIKVLGRGILETEKYTTAPYPGMDDPEIMEGVWRTQNRTKGLYFQECKNGKIEGIGVRNSCKWQALYIRSQDFEICNMNTMAMRMTNDGLDLDTVENFYIHDNFIMAGDDCFGWHVVNAKDTHEEPTRNIIADNNTFYNTAEGGNGIRFGSSMETELWENTTITNTYVLNTCTNAVMLDLQDWSQLNNIHIENVYVDNTPGYAVLHIQVAAGKYSADVESSNPFPKDDYRGHIKDVVIKNLQAENGTGTIVIGHDETHLTENVLLENITIAGEPIKSTSQILMNDYVKNLTIKHELQPVIKDAFDYELQYDDNWISHKGNWFVSSGVLKQSGFGGLSIRLRKGVYEDGLISADIQLLASGQSVGIIGRAQDDENYYLARLNSKNSKLELYKVHNNVMTLLGSCDADVQTDKVYKLFLTINGEQLQCGIDSKTMITATDNTFASGKTGLYGYTWYRNTLNEFEIDNYSVQ